MRTMKKHEFMARLENELRRRNVADSADVIEEYEQHFAFKLADGYSEEEIAARLGGRRSWRHSLPKRTRRSRRAISH